MTSLRTHGVYVQDLRGRTIEEDHGEVADVVVVGLNQLAGPLDEYNRMFTLMQARRRVSPLIGHRPSFARERTPSELSQSPHRDVPVLEEAAEPLDATPPLVCSNVHLPVSFDS